MASHTREFEKDFAKKMGVKYALMVNSGSSANLLATFAAGNPLRKNPLREATKFWFLHCVGLLPYGP